MHSVMLAGETEGSNDYQTRRVRFNPVAQAASLSASAAAEMRSIMTGGPT
jgi:hypothetical protein